MDVDPPRVELPSAGGAYRLAASGAVTCFNSYLPVNFGNFAAVIAVENCTTLKFTNSSEMIGDYTFDTSVIKTLKCFFSSENVKYAGLLSNSVAEWLACWTQAQKGLGSNRSRDAVG